MKIHDVKPAVGAKRGRIRRGRGDSSGHGNYSGRGCKGQNCRAGGGVRIGFEGGQTPLLRRIPKLKGFKNPGRVEYVVVNLKTIEEKYENGEVVSPITLVEKRILRNLSKQVKILGEGKLTKKVTFEGLKMSVSVEKAAGIGSKKKEKKEIKKDVGDEKE